MTRSKCRKNNDGISNSGFQYSPGLAQEIAKSSRHHGGNRAEVDEVRRYLDQYPEEKIKLMIGQIPITEKSAHKILSGILARANSNK